MSDIALRIEGIGKRYRIGLQEDDGGIYSYRSVRDTLSRMARHPLQTISSAISTEPINTQNSFWALKDVNFEVTKGEVVGLIGRNGAGKSTLLKILSRITKPTTGHVKLFGRVGSLLEVGTGFHPELTGRENIFLNGAVLGMSRAEVKSKFSEIVDFSETAKFLDTPVKQYSSGMYMRLAFAIAAHLTPEILVFDEVLAVGDLEFQKKCLGKMKDVAHNGRTVLFVSHQMSAIRMLCDRCVMLSSGQVDQVGPTAAVIDRYMSDSKAESMEWCNDDGKFAETAFTPSRLAAVDATGQPLTGSVGANEPIHLLIEGNVNYEHAAINVGVAVYSIAGELLFWSLSTDQHPDSWPEMRRGRVSLLTQIQPHLLNEGTYRVELIASMHCIEWISEPGRNAPSITLSVHGGLSESPYWIGPRPGILAPMLTFEPRH